MTSLSELLRHLSRPDVSELAIAPGRPPAIRVSGAFRSAAPAPLSAQDILRLLHETGSPDPQAVGEKPVQWTMQTPGLGTVSITAARRGDQLQARFVIARGTDVASAPATAAAEVAARAPPKPSIAPAPGPGPHVGDGLPAQAQSISPAHAEPKVRYHNLEGLLEAARARRASDLHVVAGRPPLLRVAGDLIPVGEVLDAEMVAKMLISQVPARLTTQLEREGSCDFALDHPTWGRFRVNIGRQRTGLKACLRVIAPEIPTLESLGLPQSISKTTHHHQGLIVITGPSGHGKTSTLTAIVDIINKESARHVITVEDPIEYVHPRKKAVMSQREVGSHTKSFQSALKGSLREDPDVIVVGELRDTETVRMAISAGETGHLLIATMNTPSAAKTIDRLIDLFPPADQGQVRMSLATGLRLIVGQRLVPTSDRKGVVAAAELLPGSFALGNLIREEKTYQIPSLQQRGKSIGIVRLDDSLAELVVAGKTTVEIARDYAESPDELNNLIHLLKSPPSPEPKKPGSESKTMTKLGSLIGRKGA